MANTANPNGSMQQYLPTVTVDGLGSLGNYDKFTGGDVTTTITKHRPGGMGPEISYLGLPVYGNVTVSRVYEEVRDHTLIATLNTLVGSTYGTVAVQPLDQNGNPYGSPRTYRGRLSAVKDGNADSTSSAPREYELEFEIETVSN